MQYARDINEWAKIMIEKNSGAYANSWLVGDTKTGEIALLELGLKNHSLEKKTNGYFAGSNITENIKILRKETRYEQRRHQSPVRRQARSMGTAFKRTIRQNKRRHRQNNAGRPLRRLPQK